MAENPLSGDGSGQPKRIVQYKRFGKVVQQLQGGFDRVRTQTEERYEETRQRRSEFGQCAQLAGLLKRVLQPYLDFIPGHYVVNHIQSRLLAIKACDVSSPKGEKTVMKGMLTPEGEKLMLRFSLNQTRDLRSVFYANYDVELELGKITVPHFNPKVDLRWPKNKVSVGLQFLLLRVDADAMEATLAASAVCQVQREDEPFDLTLETAVPDSKGFLLGFLFVGPFALFRGEVDWFKDGFTVLQVVGMG